MDETNYVAAVPGSQILGHTVRPEREYKVKRYDFKRPDKFSKEQLRTVHIIHEKVGRLLAPVLAGIVGKPVEVRCAAVDQLAFYEFFESVPEICALIPVSMSPLRGSLLMEIDGTLAQLLVRTSCGAAASEELPQPLRSFTEIERTVLRDVAEKVTPAIDEGWRTVIDLASSVVDVEIDPQMAQIVPPTEMIILGSMEVSVAGATAFINLAIPYITIEPIIAKLSAMFWYSKVRSGARQAVWHRANALPVDVELHAEATPIRLVDLAAVASGQPIELPAFAAGVVNIQAGGVIVARASADPELLSGPGALSLNVTEHNSFTALPGRPEGSGDVPGFVSTLAQSVENLTVQIKDVRQAVLEMRDDRETMLAAIGAPSENEVGVSRDSELDRRHHRDIATMLAGEDPVTIGFLIAGLPPETAAAVLADLDDSVQPEVVRSVVALTEGDRSLHRRLLAFIGRRITRSIETSTPGGVEVAVEILNNVPRSTEKHVMETFLREDKAYFEEIAKRMFVFEDFILVDPIAIGKVAARVSTEELAMAMKGIPEEVSHHIMASLESQYAEDLAEVIESIGRVRRKDVESAQRDLIEELRALEQAGEVVVARPDEVIE